MATAFPQGGRAILEQMKAKYPDLAVNEDTRQRQLIQKIGEQFAFTYGPNWGNKKRAGLSDAFRSKDSIAVQLPSGHLDIWDVFQGNAEVTTLVNDGDQPSHANLPPSEAAFMPCEPVNYLNLPTPGTTEPTPGTEEQYRELRAMLTTALVSLEELKANYGLVSTLLTKMQLRHDPMPKLLDIEARLRKGYKGRVELPGWLGGARPVILEPME